MTNIHSFDFFTRRLDAASVFLVPVVVATLAGGCSPTLPSPPSALMHLATPDTAGEGVVTVTAGLSAGGEVFGPSVVSGSLQARYGVAPRADVGISATGAAALGDSVQRTPHRGVYAARAFTHLTLVPRWLALQIGIGGGGSAAGGYLSPDVGLTFGYENPWAIPYAHANFFSSHPLTRNTLDLTLSDEDAVLALRQQYTAIGSRFGLGMRFPLGTRAAPFGSIFLEVTHLLEYGNDSADTDGPEIQRGITSLGLAYQHRFGRVGGTGVEPATSGLDEMRDR